MKKILSLILIFLIILGCLTGCDYKRKRFVKYIVNEYSFDCGDNDGSCFYTVKDEINEGELIEFRELSYGFYFVNNAFVTSYCDNIFNNDEVSVNCYSASYNYETGRMSSNETTSYHDYNYSFKDDTIEERGFLDKSDFYDCKTTTDNNIIDACITLKKRCLDNKARFEKYLGNYEIKDILIK